MKRFIATALVSLAGFATAGSLQAQTRETRAAVPFSFIVGNKQLPAGSYRLFENNSSVVILNRDQPISVVTLVDASDPQPVSSNPHLVFKKVGDRYFLSEIRCSGGLMNGTIPASKAEKQAEAQQATLQPETILLAAE